MSWVLWFWLWNCNRPGETLLHVLLNVSIYDPDIPVSSHLYSFAVGLVRDDADVLAGISVLSPVSRSWSKASSVVVIDKVRYGRENFIDLSDLKRPTEFLPVLSVKLYVCLALILDAVCSS